MVSTNENSRYSSHSNESANGDTSIDQLVIEHLARVSQLDMHTAYILAQRASNMHTVAELDSLLHIMEQERNAPGLNKKMLSLGLDLFLKVLYWFMPFIGAYYWYLYQHEAVNKKQTADDSIMTTRLIGWIIPLILGFVELCIFSGKYILDYKEEKEFNKKKNFLMLLIPLLKGEKKPSYYLASPACQISFGLMHQILVNSEADTNAPRVSLPDMTSFPNEAFSEETSASRI